MANRLSLLSLLNESPDVVYFNNKKLTSDDNDAISFILYSDNNTEEELQVSSPGEGHGSLEGYTHKKNNSKRMYDGRLWINSKIISFWFYPPMDKFKKIIDEFDRYFNIRIDNSWFIEIGVDLYNMKSEKIIIPITKYNGSKDVFDREDHLKSPTLKNNKITGNFGSKKNSDLEVKRRFQMGEALETNSNAINNLKVYHGTNVEFNKISLKYSYQGILWFTDNIEKIKGNEHGGRGNKIILTGNLTLLNPAGWDEYEKYGIGQLKDLGYDGVVLSDGDGYSDYIVFNTKSIKSLKRLKSTNEGITESPDNVIVNNGERYLKYNDTEAVAFGYINNRLLIGNLGRSHGQMGHSRDEFEYAGRVWLNSRIISFWKYPSVEMLQKILKDLDYELDEKFDTNYHLYDGQDSLLINVIPSDKLRRGDNNFEWYKHDDDGILIPIKDYQGSVEWADNVRNRPHIEVGKGGEEVPDGFGSKHNIDTSNTKSGTDAERRFKMGEIFKNK
jgi:hypothetical protein